MQITANGIALEVDIHGPADGVPLVLIRGLGSQMIHWPTELYEGFANRGYRVIRFDNRDVGLSQRCPVPGVADEADAILDGLKNGAELAAAYGMSDMARDVIGLLDALGIERAHIFGISMGGKIAQLLAMDHADRLLSASIVMTAARLRAIDTGNLEVMSYLLSRPTDRDSYIDGWMQEHATNGSPGYPMPETAIRAEAALAWNRGVDPRGINRQMLAVLTSEERTEDLTRVTLPCQVIHGQDDALIPIALGQEIADLIPDCPFHGIAGMGHIITPTLAPKIVDLVDGFIRQRGV